MTTHTESPNNPTLQNIETQWHFAVPIFKSKLNDFNAHQDGLRSFLLELQQKSPGLKKSNLNGWHSENNLHLQQEPNIQWLNQSIGAFAGQCLAQFHPGQEENTEILLTSCWGNISGGDAWNAPHNHLPCQWSGVFYVDVEESIKDNQPKDRHGLIEFMNPLPLGRHYHRPSVVTYKPEDGMILIFPGYLMHLVHPNLSDSQRISIAFNLEASVARPK